MAATAVIPAASGTPIAPDLSGVGGRYTESTLARWLRNPAAQEPTRHMPKLEMSEADARALAAYLATLLRRKDTMLLQPAQDTRARWPAAKPKFKKR